jgi:hypothetical protein
MKRMVDKFNSVDSEQNKDCLDSPKKALVEPSNPLEPKAVEKDTKESPKVQKNYPQPVQKVTEDIKPKSTIVTPKPEVPSKTIQLHPKPHAGPFKEIPKKSELLAKVTKDFKEELIHQPLSSEEDPEKSHAEAKKKLLNVLSQDKIPQKRVENPTKSVEIQCLKSILESFKIGDIFECGPSDYDDTLFTATKFNGIIIEGMIINYVMSDLPKEVTKVVKNNVTIGDFVVVSGQGGSFGRHLVLNVNELLLDVVDIDMAKVSKVKKEHVYEIPEKASDFPALACQALLEQGKMPVALCKMIEESIAENAVFKAKVVEIIQKHDRYDTFVLSSLRFYRNIN